MGKHRRYRIGIDVGLYSVGLAAVEIDDSSDNPYKAMPVDFLSIMSVIHDGGIDPSEQKYANSRKATSGTARRTRRRYKQQRKRYQELDILLHKLGYPVAQASEMVSNMNEADPYLPWRARISLVEGYIENEAKRKVSLAIAIRHIARHRGWRNPYSSVKSLIELAPVASPFYMELFNKHQCWLYRKGEKLYPGVTASVSDNGTVSLCEVPPWDNEDTSLLRPTVAQLMDPFLVPKHEFRFRTQHKEKEEASDQIFFHQGKLHQSDYCYELLRIFETQKIPSNEQNCLIEAVFSQINPKDIGAAANLVAKDDLQPSRKRASKASLAFQQFRILTTLANLRIKQDKVHGRPLTDEERHRLFDFLVSEEASSKGPDLTWHHVVEVLNIDRNDLLGAGGRTADGSPISAKQPPYLNTEHAMLFTNSAKDNLKPLSDWWKTADELSKEFFIEFLGNAGISYSNLDEEEQRAKAQVDILLTELGSLGEEVLASLDKICLSAGRAAYSVNTLSRLNQRMLAEGKDLFEARKAEFGVDNSWKPKPEPLGAPTGNPAVDRTIKIVAQWLKACEREWGKPETIFVEHVRDGFKTEKQKRSEEYSMNNRYQANSKVRDEIIAALDEQPGSHIKGKDAIRHADIMRWQAIQRQNNCCLYCGTNINFSNSQMDHIVPRKGVGCSNDLPNLVAVCADCNDSKNHKLFRSWASPERLEKTIERVLLWNRDSYFSSDRHFNSYKKDVIARLKQNEEDDPIDVRSIESVAWMARELREQIAGYFNYEGVVAHASPGNDPFALQRVQVFKGWITSEARKASGLEKKLPWLGSYSEKTRLDRRHHAVDASIIALMRPGVAKTLIERDALRREAQITGKQYKKGGKEDWRTHQGNNPEESELFQLWRDDQMQRLEQMLTKCMRGHSIVVTSPLRLRLGIGKAHNDKIFPLLKQKVGNALSIAAIDKAETPALWVALTSQDDYDANTGLPANESRQIRIHNRRLSSTDTIGFLAANTTELNQVKDAVYLRIRNGYAQIGDTIHHVRFYRVPKTNRIGAQTGWQYASLRVFQSDLIRHSKNDLFRIELPPQSISVRYAVPCLRSAFDAHTAEYLGWAVVGDEIVVDPNAKLFDPNGSQKINKFMRAFPETRKFSIAGFDTNSRITIAPREFSSEGLPQINWSEENVERIVQRTYGKHEWTEPDINAINLVIKKGCPLSVDKVLSTHPAIIRRNALGIPRWKSNNNMPTSWRIPQHPNS